MGIPKVEANLTVALLFSPICYSGLDVTTLDLIPIRLSPKVNQSTALRKKVRFSGC